MNLILMLQELDNLIIERTQPPVTSALRNKLALALEQAEAYQAASDKQDATLARQAETIAQLQQENQRLVAAQTQKQSSPFVENLGVLWKRTANGYEPHPYCNECANHPIMMSFPPGRPLFWMCSANHRAPANVSPPSP